MSRLRVVASHAKSSAGVHGGRDNPGIPPGSPAGWPVIAVAGLLAFIGIISEYLMAGLFLQDPGSKTLAVGMYGMFGDAVQGGRSGMFAAGTLITAIPTVAVFLWAQRAIVSGLTSGSVKG